MNEKYHVDLTKNNFGARGWYYIVLTAVLFYIHTGIGVDGMNVTVSAFCEAHGWDSALILNYNTLGGYIAMIGSFLLGMVLSKKGTRLVMTACLIIAGLGTIWWGAVNSPFMYLIVFAIVTSCTNAYSHLSSSNLAANWYPQKKGLFLGWSTMGLQLSSVAFVAMMSLLLGHLGLQGAYIFLGVLQIVIGIISFITVRDYPEELGNTPDNIEGMDPKDAPAYREELFKQENGGSWTNLDILKTKECWFISIGFGVLYMNSIGLLSQWVPRLLSLGFEQATAILMLSIAAAIGIVGSYIWGWLDVKIGVKKASIGIIAVYALALILTIIPFNLPCLYISLFLIGMGIGGVANLAASITGTIYGPADFARAYNLENLIMSCIRITAYSVLAFGLTHLGGYTGAYCIFFVLTVIGLICMCFVNDKFKPAPKKN